ncbi:hypothetical protein Rin_00018060 [Candidatus Regiella insecticola 5.15]|uniref:Uncharacterized protein n=1 Tax=Candidatus Regiella insecticola 5.15 TaxID=1005043 RepID=G2H169_9ENTR|nr:hypothetical protein [Candidatus Regiella insecticola]EGY28258.1 hypothetical protein Rin_00018060 [Candidatus Regiella insecticola 5.15]
MTVISDRCQRRRNLKGEGYIPTALEVAARRPEVRPMRIDLLRDSANTRSQQRGDFKGERYRSAFVFDSLIFTKGSYFKFIKVYEI